MTNLCFLTQFLLPFYLIMVFILYLVELFCVTSHRIQLAFMQWFWDRTYKNHKCTYLVVLFPRILPISLLPNTLELEQKLPLSCRSSIFRLSKQLDAKYSSFNIIKSLLCSFIARFGRQINWFMFPVQCFSAFSLSWNLILSMIHGFIIKSIGILCLDVLLCSCIFLSFCIRLCNVENVLWYWSAQQFSTVTWCGCVLHFRSTGWLEWDGLDDTLCFLIEKDVKLTQ